MENKKVCPLKFLKTASPMELFSCIEEECAWWCEWAKSCAMATIPAEISDRAHDIITTIQN